MNPLTETHPDEPRSPELLTVKEVACELRCSRAHVHNLINGSVRGTKALPAVCSGRRRLVRRESLATWIVENSAKAGLIDMIQASPEVDPADA